MKETSRSNLELIDLKEVTKYLGMYLRDQKIGYLDRVQSLLNGIDAGSNTTLTEKFVESVRSGNVEQIMKCVKMMEENELLFFIGQVSWLARLQFPKARTREVILIILKNIGLYSKRKNRTNNDISKNNNEYGKTF